MEKFVSRQKELLAMEREAELEESASLLQGLPLRDLCQRGGALQKLWLSGSRTGLYGRKIATFCQRNSTEFPAHSITSGDIVGIVLQSKENLKPECSGVVLDSKSNSISVAFEEEAIQDEFNDHQVALIKLANDVTYRRLNNALKGLSSLKTTHLADILLGQSEPSPPLNDLPPRILDGDDIKFLNCGLDESQKEAVRFSLKQRELAIIHGPPGTGKTTTITEIIIQNVRAGEKVLVCAPSNIAVDNLLERLVKEKIRCIRLGHPARIFGQLHKYSLDAVVNSSDQSQILRDIYKEIDDILSGGKKKRDQKSGFREIKLLRKELRERERKVLREMLKSAEVILGTLTSSGPDSPLKHLPEDHFSLTVIDECSQALEMACWITIPWSKKLILAGDHLQLPPTILSKSATKELEVTLMERLIKVHGESVVRMLTTQYRMNKDIMEWSSRALYSGKIVAGASVADHRLCDLPGVHRSDLTETVMLLIDTAGALMNEFTTADGVSKGNEGEARLVCRQVGQLVEAGVPPAEIAVITPYNLQVETIRMNLKQTHSLVEVRSVDGYQGREKEVVILSLVRSNPNREVGFLAERRRLNVAVTRARRQVIVICDSETVGTDKFLKDFISYLTEKGNVETPDMYSDLPDIERPLEVLQEPPSKTTEKKEKKSTETKKKPTKSSKKANPEIVSTPESVNTIYESKENKEINISKDKRTAENEIQEKFRQQLQSFLESNALTMDMECDLNANERRLAHEVAETLDLIHESVGEGKSRHIVIRRKTDELSKKSEEPESKISLQSVSTVKCNSCHKDVPKSNIDLHQLRCKVVTVETVKQKKTHKKVKPVKNESKLLSDSADFDQLCDQFQKMDKICNFDGCKVKVSVIGATCEFCIKRFCLTHSMAEIHGCGAEAKHAARQQIQRDLRVCPGSKSGPRPVDPTKRNQLRRKLDKKLEGLADNRKPKKSDK